MSRSRPTSLRPRIDPIPGGRARVIWSRSPRRRLLNPARFSPPVRTRFPSRPSTSGAAKLSRDPPAPVRRPADRPMTSPAEESCEPNRPERRLPADAPRGESGVALSARRGSRATASLAGLLIRSKKGRMAPASPALPASPARMVGNAAPRPVATDPSDSPRFRAAVESRSGVIRPLRPSSRLVAMVDLQIERRPSPGRGCPRASTVSTWSAPRYWTFVDARLIAGTRPRAVPKVPLPGRERGCLPSPAISASRRSPGGTRSPAGS